MIFVTAQNILASGYFDFPYISMLAVIISILIVLVIIIVALKSWAIRMAQPPTKYVWSRYPGASFFHEPPIPRQGTPDGIVVFAGNTTKTEDCHGFCEQEPNCVGYTHVGNTGTELANQCYFFRKYGHKVVNSADGYNSAWKIPYDG